MKPSKVRISGNIQESVRDRDSLNFLKAIRLLRSPIASSGCSDDLFSPDKEFAGLWH